MPKRGEANLLVQLPPFVASMLDDLTLGGRITKKQIIEDSVNLLWGITREEELSSATPAGIHLLRRKYRQEKLHATDSNATHQPATRE